MALKYHCIMNQKVIISVLPSSSERNSLHDIIYHFYVPILFHTYSYVAMEAELELL